MPDTSSLLFRPVALPFPAETVPQPVCDGEPGFVRLGEFAWRQAWDHVFESDRLPHSPYLNEGCRTNRIWIWDSCLMAHFARYSPAFPVEQTLDNFYDVMENRCSSGILVHHPDNPPLFAWTELLLYRISGAAERADRLINRTRSLERCYDWFENGDSGQLFDWAAMPRLAKRLRLGYMWSGLPSGMDNTPRGAGNHYDGILWLDLLAQQGLAALSIARLAEAVGNPECAARFLLRYEQKKELMQQYWDETSGCYFDRLISHGREFCRVLTPASFWPFLAEMGTPEQLEAAARTLTDDRMLGGVAPCPSVSRSDPAFDPAGGYWRGGVWVPTAYIVIKALEKYGCFDLARQLSVRLLRHMQRTFEEFSPHTIWECYSPTAPRPSTSKNGKFCRPDFCGWSALGPVSLLIENVIGIHQVDAVARRIRWNCPGTGRCGVRNLRFGGETVTLLHENGRLHVRCRSPFTLEWNGRDIACPAGSGEFGTSAQQHDFPAAAGRRHVDQPLVAGAAELQ